MKKLLHLSSTLLLMAFVAIISTAQAQTVTAYQNGTSTSYSVSQLSIGTLANAESIVVTGTWTSANLLTLQKSLKSSWYNVSNTTTNAILTSADLSAAVFSGTFVSGGGSQYLFRKCTELTEVVLPNSGCNGSFSFYYMFGGCSKLTTVTNLNQFTSINSMEGTFMNCAALQSVTLPTSGSSIVKISFDSTFSGCTVLTTINNLETFGSITSLTSAFKNCKALQSVTLSSSVNTYVNSIGLSDAFSGCESLTTINNLENFTNINSLTKTFYNCAVLTKAQLGCNPNNALVMDGTYTGTNAACIKYLAVGVTDIPQTWKDAGYTNFVLPVTVGTPTPVSIFAGTPIPMTAVPSITPDYCYRTDTVWQTSAIADFSTGVTEYALDAAIPVIENGKFFRLAVKSLNPDAGGAEVVYAGNAATLSVAEKVLTAYRNGVATDYSLNMLIPATSSTSGNLADADQIVVTGTWTAANLLVLQKSLKSSWIYSGNATANAVLQSADFSSAIFSGDFASGSQFLFTNCSELTEVILPTSGSSNTFTIKSMFSGCEKLTSVGNLDKFSNISNLQDAFKYCKALNTITFSNIDNTRSLSFNYTFEDCESLTTVNNFDKFSNISSMQNAFHGCKALGSITFSQTANTNAVSFSWAFESCESLTAINNIEKFSKISNLNFAFQNCKALQQIKLGTNPNDLASSMIANTFTGANAACLKYLPAGVTTIPQNWVGVFAFTNFVVPFTPNAPSVSPAAGGGTLHAYAQPTSPYYSIGVFAWQLSATEDFETIAAQWTSEQTHTTTFSENGYFLRCLVSSLNPNGDGTTVTYPSESTAIQVFAAPEAPTITGNLSVCLGEEVTLSSSASFTPDKIEWYKDNVLINGENNADVTVTVDATADYKVAYSQYNQYTESAAVGGAAIGDIITTDNFIVASDYWSLAAADGKTAKGVVIYVNGETLHVVGLTSVSSKKSWCSSSYQSTDIEGLPNFSDATSAIADFNGLENTNTILNTCTLGYTDCMAWYVRDQFGSDWYLPAMGEVNNIYGSAVRNAFSKLGTALASNCWSSTEKSSTTGWAYFYNQTMNMSKSNAAFAMAATHISLAGLTRYGVAEGKSEAVAHVTTMPLPEIHDIEAANVCIDKSLTLPAVVVDNNAGSEITVSGYEVSNDDFSTYTELITNELTAEYKGYKLRAFAENATCRAYSNIVDIIIFAGSEDCPMPIDDVDDLVALRDGINSGAEFVIQGITIPARAEGIYFKLTADLDLSNVCGANVNGSEVSWSPIGFYIDSDNDKPFKGYFDGNNHTINNLYINTESNYQALFGYVYGGSIENLNMTSTNVHGSISVGSVCGDLSEYSTISNCTNSGSVSGNNNVGGVCGVLSRSSASNCTSSGSVSVTADKVGGVCGYALNYSTISNCANNAEVSGPEGETKERVGGVCGYALSSTISNSANGGSVNGANKVGGVCGEAFGTIITSCANSGDVIGTGDQVAGVCGRHTNQKKVSYCTNSGNVSGINLVGGICGYEYFYSNVEYCVNSGSISGTGDKVGGVCGEANSLYNVRYCMNSGSVSGNGDNVGGVCGIASSSNLISNYYDKQMCAVGDANAEGKLTTEMTGLTPTGLTGLTGTEWLFAAGMYPRVNNGFENTDAAMVAATPVFLYVDSNDNSQYETVNNIAHNFTVGTNNEAAWSSTNDKVNFNNGSATLLLPGNAILTASFGNATKQISINISAELPLVVNTPNDEINPNDGLISLREAINYAGTGSLGNEITFDENVFATQQTITLGSTLTINKDISIDGAGKVILDGGHTVGNTNGVRIMDVATGEEFAGISVTLSNLTFQNGYTTNYGSAIVNLYGTLIINNSTFSGNTTLGYGGVIVNCNMLTVNKSRFTGNTASGNGGAIKNESTLAVNNSTFSGNTASGNGGAIYNSATLTVNNSTLSGNSAGDRGGAIYTTGYYATYLVNSILVGNTAATGNDLFVFESQYAPTRLFVYYSLIGNCSGSLADSIEMQTDVTTDIFESTTLNADGTFHIKANGAAATSGTLVATNAYGNYYFKDSDTWRLVSYSTQTADESALTIITTDQVGNSRTTGTAASLGIYAAGASFVEASLANASLLVSTADDVINPNDEVTSLREALILAGTNDLGNEITFDNTVFNAENHSVTLSENEINIDKDLIITGLTGINHNITANITANINVNAGKKLIVNNISTDNKVKVNLKSDAIGDAVLIHNSQIYGTMERYMNGDNQWHFLSSPVVNQDISDGNFACAKINDAYAFNYDFYLYDEKNYLWKNYKNTDEATGFYASNDNSDNFVTGRGYLTAYESAQGETSVTKTFSGVFNQGTISIPLTYSSSVEDIKGFNLVGNPYPSAIDWNASGWNKSGINGYVYIWDETSQNYATYQDESHNTLNGSRYIAPAQGFFVKATSENQSLLMTNDVRTTETAAFRGTSSDDTNILKLNVSNKFGKDEVAVTFGAVIQSEAIGVNKAEFAGAEKLFGSNEDVPSLYLINNDTKYSILNLGKNPSIHSIPMSFEAGANGFYTINLNSDASKFDFLELEDLQEKVKVNLLSEEKYTFTGNLGDNPNRFRINFIVNGEDNDDVIGNEPVIYVSNHDLVVENISGNGTIEVIDIQGKVVRKYDAAGSFRKDVDLSENVYLVRVIDGNGVNVNKIFYR